MATRKSVTRATAEVPLPPPNPKDQALANLARDFTAAGALCYDLQADGRLGDDAQRSFWQLATGATLVAVRFDPVWVAIVDEPTTTLAELLRLIDLANAAVERLQRARASPSSANLGDAMTAMASLVDQVDAMVDKAER